MPNFDDNDIDLTEHADEAGSTFVRMEVEDYDGSARHSYLRLGAVDSTTKRNYQDLVDNGTAQDWTVESGEDLASMVTTFIDDECYRGDAGGKFLTMDNDARRAETKLLHTKGGWRDHTDGNRITTTRGDKIEVIRGNYKMRVLGRSQWNDDKGSGLHLESSGGITYAYDEVPGQIVDVRRAADDSTWEVYEECHYGHTIDRFHGVRKEWSRGGDVIDRVGKGSWQIDDSDFALPDNASHMDEDDFPPDSENHKVQEQIYANEIYEKVICNKHEVHEQAATVDEKTRSDVYEETMEYDTFFGLSVGAMAVELWGAKFFENFDGAGMSIKTGAFVDLRLGAAAEVNASVFLTQADLCGWSKDIEAAAGWMDGFMARVGLTGDYGLTRIVLKAKETKTSMSMKRFAMASFLG